MFTVALTGGIASGKNVVSTRFHQHGIDVFDADVVARDLVAPGQPALEEIKMHFGSKVLTLQGTLDRERMREYIFGDPAQRKQLETILHPRISLSLRRAAKNSRTPYCVLAIPLLVECLDDYRWVDRILLVDTPEPLQMERLIQRDLIGTELAQRMVAAQTNRKARLAIANDVIENTDSIHALIAAVDKLHERYLQFAANRSGNIAIPINN